MCMRWDSLRFLFGVNSQSVKVMHSCTIEPQRSIRIRRSCLRRTSRTFKSVIRKPIRTQNPLSSPSSLSQAVIDITARVFEFHYFPLFLVCVFFCFPFCFFHYFFFSPPPSASHPELFFLCVISTSLERYIAAQEPKKLPRLEPRNSGARH